MDIKIETSDGYKKEVHISELNKQERAALAGLLGMNTRKAHIFRLFRELDPFKNIKPKEVWNLCPQRGRFSVDLEVTRASPEVEEEALQILSQIDPDADFLIKNHKMGGYCKKCGVRHEVERNSALVFLEYMGFKYSKRFEV